MHSVLISTTGICVWLAFELPQTAEKKLLLVVGGNIYTLFAFCLGEENQFVICHGQKYHSTLNL